MKNVYTVAQVNSYIKNMFSQDFMLQNIYVKGEVSNCKYHSSGHIYFTLKDGGSQIAAVMFAGQRKGLAFDLEEGQEVTVTGNVDVYERDGRYQLYAKEITREGKGDLFRQFEKLRNELEEMGMFAQDYKQPIPKHIRTLGVVTAPTGAAVQDIRNVAGRRNPYVQLILYPALVQGQGAKESIVNGIRTLDAMGLDVLIVGRGGGSIEDLWAFNEEEVARAIFACETPVISAVGHETDVTVADYVADLRAPTPSAAAELAVFDYARFAADLEARKRKLSREMGFFLDQVKGRLRQDELKIRLYHPQHVIREKRQRLADQEERLERIMDARTGEIRSRLQSREERLSRAMDRRMEDDKKRLAEASGRLWGLSPLRKLSQGFGYIEDQEGKRLGSVKQAPPGSGITVQVADGTLSALVTERNEESGWQNWIKTEQT